MCDPEAVIEHRRGEFVISTDRLRLNLDLVHDFLTNCYWAQGISREVVTRSIEHSLCFGIYEESSRLAKEAETWGARSARASRIRPSHK